LPLRPAGCRQGDRMRAKTPANGGSIRPSHIGALRSSLVALVPERDLCGQRVLESHLGDNCLCVLARRLVRVRLMLVCWQLQDRRELSCHQRSERHDCAILKFERVMVPVGHTGIDLPEPRQLAWRDRFLMRYRVFENRLRSERNLCPWAKAYGCVEVANPSKAPGDRVVESRGNELVCDGRWSRGDVLEAIVTYVTLLPKPPSLE
jgi:hypothetical protein